MKRMWGLFAATLPYYTEAIWSRFVEYFGDTFYRDKRQQAKEAEHPSGVVSKAKELVDGAARTVAGTAAAAADKARDVAGQAYVTVAGTAAAAGGTVRNVAGTATDTLTAATQKLADLAPGTGGGAGGGGGEGGKEPKRPEEESVGGAAAAVDSSPGRRAKGGQQRG